jgi:xanthine dehydrogenase small subunit
VAELRVIRETPQSLFLGGAVTYSRAQPLLTEHFPAFAQLLERLGSLQIRNRGTLGGNVANASPIGDCPPVLLALDARLHLRSLKGERTVPVSGFFTGYRTTVLQPGEFIESLELPKLGAGEDLKVYKISKRFDDDISAVCLALWLKREGERVVDVRIGCGGMAATPARALQAEQALRGRPLDEGSVEVAKAALAQDFTPLDDVRASAAYRLAVAGNLLLRALLELRGEAVQVWRPAGRGGEHA